MIVDRSGVQREVTLSLQQTNARDPRLKGEVDRRNDVSVVGSLIGDCLMEYTAVADRYEMSIADKRGVESNYFARTCTSEC